MQILIKSSIHILAYVHGAIVAVKLAVMLLNLDTPLSEDHGVIVRETALDLIAVLRFDRLDAVGRAILGVNNLSLLTANTTLNDRVFGEANKGLNM